MVAIVSLKIVDNKFIIRREANKTILLVSLLNLSNKLYFLYCKVTVESLYGDL